MDPVSQGALGAIFAQTISNKKKILIGSTLGCVAGLAPDLDIFIRSSSDQLLIYRSVLKVCFMKVWTKL